MDDERRRAPRRAWSHGAANEAGWAVSRRNAAGPSVSVAGGGRSQIVVRKGKEIGNEMREG